MGKFADLKMYGKKNIKFNQSKCMNNELKNDFERDEKIRASKGGMCYIFSHAYVRDFLMTSPTRSGNYIVRGITTNDGFSPSGYSRTGGGAKIDGASSAIVRAALVANQMYDKLHNRMKVGNITQDNLRTTLAAYFGLTVVPAPGEMFPDTMDEVLGLFNETPDTQAWIVGLHMDAGAHAVVLARRAKRYFFFDPNVGGYEIYLGRIGPFLTTWADCYITAFGKKFKINFTAITAFDVNRAPKQDKWIDELSGTVSKSMLASL